MLHATELLCVIFYWHSLLYYIWFKYWWVQESSPILISYWPSLLLIRKGTSTTDNGGRDVHVWWRDNHILVLREVNLIAQTGEFGDKGLADPVSRNVQEMLIKTGKHWKSTLEPSGFGLQEVGAILPQNEFSLFRELFVCPVNVANKLYMYVVWMCVCLFAIMCWSVNLNSIMFEPFDCCKAHFLDGLELWVLSSCEEWTSELTAFEPTGEISGLRKCVQITEVA